MKFNVNQPQEDLLHERIKTTMAMERVMKTKTVKCPKCGGHTSTEPYPLQILQESRNHRSSN